jgi:hypothetical protein
MPGPDDTDALQHIRECLGKVMSLIHTYLRDPEGEVIYVPAHDDEESSILRMTHRYTGSKVYIKMYYAGIDSMPSLRFIPIIFPKAAKIEDPLERFGAEDELFRRMVAMAQPRLTQKIR